MAAAFDLDPLALSSAPVAVADEVAFNPSGAGKFDISDNGNLLVATAISPQRALVWAAGTKDPRSRKEP